MTAKSCRLPQWDGTEGEDTTPVKVSTPKEIETFYDDHRIKLSDRQGGDDAKRSR